MKIKLRYSAEELIILYLILQPIYILSQIIIGTLAHFLIPMFFIVLFILSKNKMSNFRSFAFFVLIFIASIPYSLLRYSNYLYNFFGLMYLLFFVSLPWLIVGLNINNVDKLIIEFKNQSKWIFLTNVILLVFSLKSGRDMTGNMEISYSILPLTIFSLYLFLNEYNIKYLILFVFSGGIIVFYGSRGPLLCIAIFLLSYILLNLKNHKFILICLVSGVMFFAFNFDTILRTTTQVLYEHNIESRTLFKLLNGDFTDGTGRETIYSVVFDEIKNEPLLGVGLGGDRIIINKQIYNFNKDMSSSYPHNLFLEILLQYGMIIGTFFSIFIILIIIMAFIKGNKQEKNLILILFSTEFIRLMISSSYMVSVLFFLMLGFCINIIKTKQLAKRYLTKTNYLI